MQESRQRITKNGNSNAYIVEFLDSDDEETKEKVEWPEGLEAKRVNVVF